MSQADFEIPNMLVGVWPANIDMSTTTNPGSPPDYQYTVVDLYAVATGVDASVGAGLNLASAGYPALGTLQNNPQKNEAGTVMIQGISKARAGTGGWAIGQLLMSDGAGALVAATSGNHAIAKAMSAASAGDISSALIKSYGKV